MSHNKYRHCIFDFYGTLADIHTEENSPSLWQNMTSYYKERGAAYEPEELMWAYQRLVKSLEAGMIAVRNDAHEAHPEIQIEKVFTALFEEKGKSCSLMEGAKAGRYFRQQSMDYLRLYPYAEELLVHLRDAGCKVWLLSNAQAIFTRYELEMLKLTDLFDGIYLSSDYGCKKPSAAFFAVLLNERNIDPKTAVMIGNDGICDILGAKEAGLDTIYIHSNISPKEEFPKADLVLPCMDLKKVEEFLME